LRVTKDLTLNFEFFPNEYSTFEIKPWKYQFLGTKVSKLDLINLITELWPYTTEIKNFDLKIMPWLEVFTQKNYKIIYTNEYLEIQNILLREYCLKKGIALTFPLKVKTFKK
jgi:hypothetical protein